MIVLVKFMMFFGLLGLTKKALRKFFRKRLAVCFSSRYAVFRRQQTLTGVQQHIGHIRIMLFLAESIWLTKPFESNSVKGRCLSVTGIMHGAFAGCKANSNGKGRVEGDGVVRCFQKCAEKSLLSSAAFRSTEALRVVQLPSRNHGMRHGNTSYAQSRILRKGHCPVR